MSRRRPGYPGHEFRGLGPPVGEGADGLRADLFLARQFPFRSRREWREACSLGQLLVNGAPVRASRRLKPGDKLTVWHPPTAEPEVDTTVETLVERDGILALLKPGNLPMHESGLFWRKTLHAVVAARFGPDWHAVHRLDRETSGVVIHAACPDLRRSLSFAFEEQRVEKTYVAIVRGEAAFDEIEVEAPIGQDPTTFYPRWCVRQGGAPAITRFRVLERRAGATLLEARPRTGRFNQIRIHASYLGLPLVGDKLYRGEGDDRVFLAYHRHGNSTAVQRLAGFPRHCLHAARVAFLHPLTGERFVVEAPLPDDMRRLWSAASFEQDVASEPVRAHELGDLA